MMIGRLVIACFAIVLFLFDVSDGAKPQCDSTLNECSVREVEELLEDVYPWYFGFNRVYTALNCRQCRIDTTDLKKMLMRILNSGFPKVSESREKIDNAAWRAMVSKEGWNDEMEKFVKKVMDYHKINNLEAYYWNARTLVKRSRNWFLYAMDVYQTKDTAHLYERGRVIRAVIERFKEGGNPAEMAKVESLLYSILERQYFYDFYSIDNYLSGISTIYRDSKERKIFCEKVEKEYNDYRNKPGWREMFDHIKKVNKHFSSISTLTDYKPPIEIE